jgi:hydrogenase-4 membrane subunit HyfE
VSIAIIISAAVLVIDSRLRTALLAYVVFTIGVLWISFPHDATPIGIVIFALLAFVKVVAGPAAIVWLRFKYRVPDDLGASSVLGIRVAVVAGALFLAHEFSQTRAFADVHDATIVFYALFASICIVLLHRNLLAHVIGLLTLGSAVSLAAAIFAPELPGAIELADTFDAVFATLIGIGVARAVIRHDPQLDIRSLRLLRG